MPQNSITIELQLRRFAKNIDVRVHLIVWSLGEKRGQYMQRHL